MNWKWFLFSFEGRINRKPFWLFNLTVFALFGILDFAVNGKLTFKRNIASTVFSLAILWPVLAVQAKRWHDRNKSGWWQSVNIVPIIGGLWSLFEVGLLEGTQGENRFGKDLLEGVEKRYALKRQLTTKEITSAAAVFVFLILALFSWLLIQVFRNANN
jgi:uncharacterized membrane protein YhaH (DUF805 family)